MDGPDAAAVAVAGDTIIAVGARSDVLRHVGPDTRVVDLDGRALLPGFVDAHSHFFENPDAAGTDLAGMSDFILRSGITTTAEMHTTPELLAVLRDLDRDGLLGVRINAYLIATDACGNVQDEWWRDHPPTRERGQMLRIGGVKVFANGGACNVPAVSFEYLNGLGMGDLYFTPAQLAGLIGRIEDAGHQAAVHALGDRAIETVLDAYAEVLDGGPNPMRHRLEHSAATRPDLRARHSEVGVVTTMTGAFPACFFAGRLDGFNARTPPDYLEWEWPWHDILEANPQGRFGWHADFPVFSPNAGSHLAGFVTRGQVHPDGSYCEAPPTMAGQLITVDQALRLMTTGSAYALGREADLGSLTVGKLADMVVLSKDPRAIEPRAVHDLEVLATIIGGRVGWCAPGSESLCPPAVSEPGMTPAAISTASAGPAIGTNVARHAPATASSSLAGQGPGLAVDGDLASSWNAGAGAVQSIELDLGTQRPIRRLRFIVEQFPEGETRHRILAVSDGGEERLLHEFQGRTAAHDVLDVTFAEPQVVRWLRIVTLSSPSWIAWSEIEAYE